MQVNSGITFTSCKNIHRPHSATDHRALKPTNQRHTETHAKYAWSGRERLGMLRVRGDAIVLHAMHWPNEIRDPAELLPPPVDVSEEEIKGALALMESMSRDDLEGNDFTDTYTEAMEKIIEAKREEKPLPEMPEPEQPGRSSRAGSSTSWPRSNCRNRRRRRPRRRLRPRRMRGRSSLPRRPPQQKRRPDTDGGRASRPSTLC
ncbi:hypothetical protein ABZT34_30190 [Streptomyces sp. NPDC005329]|uniref:hypothetical protein n=1 Tax=Streptomyces sp. NPDC005329 TaxID=3157034 RepID=UPI0033A3D883